MNALLGFVFEGVFEVNFLSFEAKRTFGRIEVFAAIQKDLVLKK
jgi:hypothetical protein